MKIIAIDNFNRENVDDILVAENVNRYYGKLIVDLLNQKFSVNYDWFYKLVDDDYKLYKFEY